MPPTGPCVSDHRPRVSVGLPVYNGERFLRQAIDSILNQTYRDFELIISDNASTDSTETICRSYEAKDSRVRYDRNEVNIGANPNHRRVFSLSRAEYFKWAGHDDLIAPDFLEECVRVLDGDSSIALCYTREIIVDDAGREIGRRSYELGEEALLSPENLFRTVLGTNLGTPAFYGLMRRDILGKTALLGTTYAADQVLLAELALHGKFHEIPEFLLLHREHPQRSIYEHRTRQDLMAWVEPSNSGKIIFPTWRVVADYFSAISHSPTDWRVRLRCAVHVARWVKYHWPQMSDDLKWGTAQLAYRVRGKWLVSHRSAREGRP